MGVLQRKLARDIWHYRGQLISVLLVMAAGIALFVSLRSMNGYLSASQADYYRRDRFADVFVTLSRAPESVARDIARIPGVKAVETRVVGDVLMDTDDSDEIVTARLVSIPDHGEPVLNRLVVTRGRSPERRDEAVMSQAFAHARRVDVGSSIALVINGQRQRFHVVGLGLSPEFVYEIRGGTDIFPDNRRFGVVWAPRSALASAFDLEGAFNDLAVSLEPAAAPAAVIDALDRRVDRYGGIGAYGRRDHLSHRFVSDEITETRVTSVLIPTIFLGVTAFLLHVVMSRLVGIEREQIAVLRAFGFPARHIVVHYLLFAAVPMTLGAILGTLSGLYLAGSMARMYARFFQFPYAHFEPDPAVIAIAVGVSALAAGAGSASAVRAVLRLPPAEAMRPSVPPMFRRGLAARLGLERHVPARVRMTLRTMERRPGKTILALAGLSLATGLIVVGGWAFDALDHVKDVEFHRADRSDLSVVFNRPRANAVRYALSSLEGVSRVETFRAVPVRLRNGRYAVTTTVVGFEEGASLRRVLDSHGRPVPIRDGLTLTGLLAERLHVAPGDAVDVEVLEGARRRTRAVVAASVNEMVGSSAYATLASVHTLAGGPTQVNGAWLRVDPANVARVSRELEKMPEIAGVGLRRTTLESFERTVQESFRISLGTMFAFAVLIATGIVYNNGRIALSERARELASLRVLGFTRRETAAMFLGEQAALVLMALPAGILCGYGFCALLTLRTRSELFRLPLVVEASTYVTAVLVVGAAGIVTVLTLGRRVMHLNLIDVLKARE